MDEIYKARSPIADKLLYPDGSIRQMDGTIIEAADERRAEIYKARSPNVAKWLLADGSIVEELPGSGSGGSSDVTKDYVNQQDVATLRAAKEYIDEQIAALNPIIQSFEGGI